jgi:hypothetical protein
MSGLAWEFRLDNGRCTLPIDVWDEDRVGASRGNCKLRLSGGRSFRRGDGGMGGDLRKGEGWANVTGSVPANVCPTSPSPGGMAISGEWKLSLLPGADVHTVEGAGSFCARHKSMK